MPFDVFQLRHIDYEDTGIGLTKLSEDLNKAFDYIDEHPDFLDSQVLEVASYKKYKFLKFGDEDEIEKKKQNSKIDAIIKLSENPKLFEIFNDNTIPDDKKSIMAIQELAKSPANAKAILGALVDSGEVNLNLVSKSTNGRKLKRR
ncbi:MAG: hypothetical protein NHB15_14920 [Methanosarcina barkeri]|nr:hypothetical protein [Methanosarcina sp. ERenArc_MAG2]